MKFLVRTLLALTIISQSALADQPLKQPETVWHNFAVSEVGAFQWKVDPETNKMNFRTCERQENELRCRKPMLMRGMNPEDLNLLLDFYVENLASSSGFSVKQVWGLLGGTFVTAALAIAPLKQLQGLSGDYPRLANLSKKLSTSLGVITGAAIIYLLVTKSIEQYRQGVITKKMRHAINTTPAIPPELRFEEPAVYREFVATFRQFLWDFTHGGNGYHSDVNIMLQ